MPLPTISGYQITYLIHESEIALIYKGIRFVDEQAVILKLLKHEHPSIYDLLRLRNYYNVTKNLRLQGVIQPLALENYGQGLVLVMPDDGYQSLDKYKNFIDLTLPDILAIAIQLATILHDLYQHQIIHKNIKPANILIHPESKQIQLIDFSLATLLQKEIAVVKHPNILEGTLAYLAPEQTGRMNRGIDYRTDFYALGVTLFELFTGTLPFQSEDPLELVHYHIARTAPQLTELNPDLSPTLGQIVAKLMAKNAEDRYQSALGLKHDLEIAFDQLHRTGVIQPFEIASRDISDRFIIPEKLYGREQAVQTLLDAFDRVNSGSSELMLVTGFSGIGKTAVVSEIHKPILKQQSYFIKGKFDQLNRNIPFQAFVQALRDLMRQLLSETDAQLQDWKTKILAVLGENAQVMIDVIPELEQIIGAQLPALELSGSAAEKRFNLLFHRFIQLFTVPGHPLVIFLDDLQWADSASLNLLRVILENVENLLILGAYRNNEVSPLHPFTLTLQQLKKVGTTINTLTLEPLEPKRINQWVAETLKCDLILAEPLSGLVYQKTCGNPFFTAQFLKVLYQDQYIQFNSKTGHWQCDISQIKIHSLTDNVVDLMIQQLQKLPSETQELLKLAACIGTQFDLQTLAIISGKSETTTAIRLWIALQESLIIPLNQIYKFFQKESEKQSQTKIGKQDFLDSWILASGSCTYRFLHDRVQQAAYALIPTSEKEAAHLQIGRLLLERIPTEQRDSKLFSIVNQLNCGIQLIQATTERQNLAQLNWSAGKKARMAAAYDAALSYLKIGIQLLSSQHWQTQYELSLNLYQLAAEVAYLAGLYDQMTTFITIGLQYSKTHLDQAKFHEIQILALIAQNQAPAAIQQACQILPRFGIYLPRNLFKLRTILGFLITLYRMFGKTPDDLLKLPAMSDPYKLAACSLLNAIGAATERGMPELLPFMTFIGIGLYLRYGNIPKSSMAYTIYAFLLCEKLGQVETGYAIGKAAIALCQTTSKTALAPTLFLWNRFIAYRKEPLQSTLPALLEAYQASLEAGDIEYAAYSLCVYYAQAYWVGQNLVDLQQEAVASRPTFEKFQQHAMTALHNLNCQALENLTTGADDVCKLVGQFFDETKLSAADWHLQAYTSIRKLQIAFLFQRYSLAIEQTYILEKFLAAFDGSFTKTLFYFYDALVRLAQYPHLTQKQQKHYLTRVNHDRRYLSRLAKSAPMNYQHKLFLIEAEHLRVLGQWGQAREYYDLAIAGAKANGFIYEEALANELAARFYLERGQEKIAQIYIIEAYYGYVRWGASVKVRDLENLYPQLLSPILQTERSLTTLKLISSVSHDLEEIDLSTLLKASQAISEEIELSKLLAKLLNIIIANAGADKCVLLLQGDQELQIVGRVESGQHPQILPSPTPLLASQDVAISLVNRVKHSLEPLVLNNVCSYTQLVFDPYFEHHHPQSILCSPLLKQGQLRGILYLENHLMIDAFTQTRLDMLNLLCIQVAISVENAQLYSNLEHKVSERTQELSQTLANLQSTQVELIQAEKMALLGQLTASVAHEINTPLGVIRAASSNITAAFQDFLLQLPFLQRLSVEEQTEFLTLVNTALQQPSKLSTQEERKLRRQLHQELNHQGISNADQVAAQLTLLHLEAELLPAAILRSPRCTELLQAAYNFILQYQSIQQIQQEVDRAAKIVFALKTYSHKAIAEGKTLVAITESLEIALTLYQNRLNQGIQLIRHYAPEVPKIFCNPDELTQVWVNLIDNAIYAMGQQGILEIAVTHQNDWVVIEIIDSGCGIPLEMQHSIFDPFITTKPRGEGSGLGLDIVRQIVQNHRGEIQVQSCPGRTAFIIQLPLKS